MNTDNADRWWNYRGYVIWFFDGYYDVQITTQDEPLDTFYTVEDARAFINERRMDRRLMVAMGMEDEK